MITLGASTMVRRKKTSGASRVKIDGVVVGGADARERLGAAAALAHRLGSAVQAASSFGWSFSENHAGGKPTNALRFSADQVAV